MTGLSDRVVILALLLTLVVVFGLVFSTRALNGQRGPSPLLWREAAPSEGTPPEAAGTLRI